MRLFFANMHRHWGGQSTAVVLLAAELSRRGHDVIVAGVAGSELIKRAQAAGLKTFNGLELRRGFRMASFFRDQRALKHFWAEFRPDGILTNGAQDTWACAVARRRFFPSAFLVRWRHNSFKVANHVFNRWLYRRLIDHVVVSSAAIAPLLTAKGLVPADHITVFPPTTTLDDFLNADIALTGEDARATRQKLAVPQDGWLVLSVGRLAPEKGYDSLVRAWRRVREALPGAKLAIAGLGSQEEPLKKLIAEHGLQEHVFLLGFRDDVPALYAQADLAVLTPRAGESFGIALLEAYASGKACVATDVGGVRDLVIDGETGFLVPADDEARISEAIIKCLRDAALRARLAEAGKARVLANFTPEKLGDRAEALFGALLGKSGASERTK